MGSLLYHYFPTKDALLIAAVQPADALVAALDRAAQGPPAASLAAGLGAYLDHVQADPTGWHAVLQARSGALADIGDAVEEHGRRLMMASLGVRDASLLLRAALDGWAALERGACLTWLRYPEIARSAIEDLLMTSFLATLEAVARHDEQARDVLARLH